jgi:hypothetical protein
MLRIMILVAALALVTVGRGLLMAIIVRLFGRAIGEQAIAQQPDRIQLVRATPGAWQNSSAAAALADPLLRSGFDDAGTFRVQEMPGLVVRLLANPAEGFLAAVYEHPKAGHWLDLVTRYGDRTSVTFTTHGPTGLSLRPGHPVFNMTGASANALLVRARADRPRGSMAPVSTQRAQSDFEDAYGEAIEWRKRRGVSADEVAKVVSLRKAA